MTYTVCPMCGTSALTRVERVIKGTLTCRSNYCGVCRHMWETPDVVPVRVRRHARRPGRRRPRVL